VLANLYIEAKTFVVVFIYIFVNIYRRFPLILFTIPCPLLKKMCRPPYYVFIINNRFFFYSSRFVLNLLSYLFFVLLIVYVAGRNTRYNLKKKLDESPPNNDNNISPKYYFKIKNIFNEFIKTATDYEKSI